MNHIIGIAEMGCSDNPDDILTTYSLGSCLGVAIYDPVAHVGGMIHCMLPLSKIDREKASVTPCMFVDTGLPLLLEALFRLGLQKTRAIVKSAGAANVLDTRDLFKIGERNHVVFRKIMWKNSILIAGEDIGGSISRTIRLEIDTGSFYVKSQGKEKEI